MNNLIKSILGESDTPEDSDAHLLSPEEEEEYQGRLDDEASVRFEKERNLSKLIRARFDAAGVTVRYDKNPDVDLKSREVVVELEDSNISVKDLAALKESGLSEDGDYKVTAGDYTLSIEFILPEGIETADISSSFNKRRLWRK